jgi:DNA-binding transcriptional regulator YdaS (Cro superfamily)
MTCLDPAPLLALFPGQPGAHIARHLGVTPSTVSKWRLGHHRIRPTVADRAATRAGLHPLLLWPELPQRTMCGNGHDLTGPNAYRYPTGLVACRTCRDGYRQAWRDRNTA